MLAYIGPESVLPATSILAAVLGFVLMFWRSLVNQVKRPFQPRSSSALSQSSEAPTLPRVS